MLNCTECKIRISTRTDQCPLCHRSLPDCQDLDLMQTYPAFVPVKNRSCRWVKAIAMIIVILLLCSFGLSSALSYVIPIILFSLVFTINILLLVKKNFKKYIKLQLLLCMISFIPLIFAIFEVTQPLYLSLIAAFGSGLTLSGLFIFLRKELFSELSRIFHI